MLDRDERWEGNRADCGDKKWGGIFKWIGQGRPPLLWKDLDKRRQ